MDQPLLHITSVDTAVASIKNLRRNWDGNNSPAFKVKVIKLLETILKDIDISKLPLPKLTPISGGAVGLLWANHNNEAILVITPECNLEFELITKKYDEIHDEYSVQETTTGTLVSAESVGFLISLYCQTTAGNA